MTDFSLSFSYHPFSLFVSLLLWTFFRIASIPSVFFLMGQVMFLIAYLALEVRNWNHRLKVFFQSTFRNFQKTDSNPNKAQDHGRNERRLELPRQYEIDPGILRLADQPLSFLACCSNIVALHLGCYEL